MPTNDVKLLALVVLMAIAMVCLTVYYSERTIKVKNEFNAMLDTVTNELIVLNNTVRANKTPACEGADDLSTRYMKMREELEAANTELDKLRKYCKNDSGN